MLLAFKGKNEQPNVKEKVAIQIAKEAEAIIDRCGLLEDDYKSVCKECRLAKRPATECSKDCPVGNLHDLIKKWKVMQQHDDNKD